MRKQKERILDDVAEGAADLFLEKSITAVTMEEIARYVGIGPASMYRYFGTKQALAVRVAVLLARNTYNEYFSDLKGSTGFEKLKSFYMAYLKIFCEKREYYRFLREFDLLYLSQAGEEKSDYEKEIDNFYLDFCRLLDMGIDDGSIREICDREVFYLSTTHALLNLCKSLSRTTALVSQDENVEAEEQIKMIRKFKRKQK